MRTGNHAPRRSLQVVGEGRKNHRRDLLRRVTTISTTREGKGLQVEVGWAFMIKNDWREIHESNNEILSRTKLRKKKRHEVAR